VRIDERDGQHNESVTKYLEKVTPSFCILTTWGMNPQGFQDKSSVRMKTKFGRRRAVPGALADGPGPAVRRGASAASFSTPVAPFQNASIPSGDREGPGSRCRKLGFAALHAATSVESIRGSGLLALARWRTPCRIGRMQSAIRPKPSFAAPCLKPACVQAVLICLHGAFSWALARLEQTLMHKAATANSPPRPVKGGKSLVSLRSTISRLSGRGALRVTGRPRGAPDMAGRRHA
jgi:hypothetical protein